MAGSKLDITIGFVGAGQMAQALASGMMSAGLVDADQLVASDPFEASRQGFAARMPGARVSDDNAALVQDTDVLFLAVKPQQMTDVLGQIRTSIKPENCLVVSIAAGITLATLESQLPAGTRVIRVMPNTPCLVGAGVSAYSLGTSASSQDGGLVRELLTAVGGAHPVDEKQLAAVTGLSGSGPAFVYTVIEALTDGGVAMGLPRALAGDLATRTVAGAAQMVLETGEHPGVLRDRVTSPGGTTIAGMATLEQLGLRSALIEGVRAATERADQLGGIANPPGKS